MDERKLYVPANVSVRNEVWAGFSVKDGMKSLLFMAIAAAFLFLLSRFLPIPLFFGVFATMLTGFASVGLHTRVPEVNRSILDQIGIVLRFTKSQKTYHYVYVRGAESAETKPKK